MRPATKDEIERLRKTYADMRMASVRYQLAIEEIRAACGALPSHTVLDDESGRWQAPPQQGQAAPGPHLASVPPSPLPTAAYARRLKGKR